MFRELYYKVFCGKYFLYVLEVSSSLGITDPHILSQTYNATRFFYFVSHLKVMQYGLQDICWSAIAREQIGYKDGFSEHGSLSLNQIGQNGN